MGLMAVAGGKSYLRNVIYGPFLRNIFQIAYDRV